MPNFNVSTVKPYLIFLDDGLIHHLNVFCEHVKQHGIRNWKTRLLTKKTIVFTNKYSYALKHCIKGLMFIHIYLARILLHNQAKTIFKFPNIPLLSIPTFFASLVIFIVLVFILFLFFFFFFLLLLLLFPGPSTFLRKLLPILL